MRQQYENNETLKAESDFAKYIEARWDCEMKKMHLQAIWPFATITKNLV